MPPVVSIILPLYNGRAFVGETLASLESQTFQEAELIVVDDGSKDGGLAAVNEICQKSPSKILAQARLFSKENGGVARARNYGIERSNGRYVALLDQDDIWEPSRLERMVALLENDNLRWGYSAYVRFYNDGREILKNDGSQGHSETLEKLVMGGLFIPPSASLVERSLIDEIGGFIGEYAPSDDWDFFLKLCERERGGYIEEPLVRFRSHKTSSGKRLRMEIFRAQEEVLNLHEPLVRGRVSSRAIAKRRGAINLHMALSHWSQRERAEAKRRFKASLASWPGRFKTWFLYLKFLLGLKK